MPPSAKSNRIRRAAAWWIGTALALSGCGALAPGHAGHADLAGASPAASTGGVSDTSADPCRDARQPVALPAALKAQTLANMRDHLLALAEIQDALASGRADAAGEIAEQRLGLGSLQRHGAHELGRFMPPGMQVAGLAMHRSASRLALAAQNSAVTGEVRPALAEVAGVTQACVACHAAYRLD